MAEKDTNKKIEDEDMEEEEQEQSTVGKHNTGAADLAKMSGLSLDDDDNNQQSAKDISGALSIIDSNRSKEDAEKAAKKKELERIKLKKEDVIFMMKEMELSETEAELKLRHASGNLVQALLCAVNE